MDAETFTGILALGVTTVLLAAASSAVLAHPHPATAGLLLGVLALVGRMLGADQELRRLWRGAA